MLIIERQGATSLLSINRPKVHNAFNAQLIAKLTTALKILAEDSATKVILLKSQGKHFSAGADVHWMAESGEFSEAENLADAKALGQLMETFFTVEKPVVAAVQGACYGGANGLISCADVVFAEYDARFCFSEVKMGIIPAVISPYVMRAIGERQCRRYFLSAEVIEAQTAREINLVNELVPLAELNTQALAFAERLTLMAPQALTACKNLIRHVGNTPMDDKLHAYTQQAIATRRISDEGQEGLKAFLEKRPPNWIAKI